MARIDGKWIDSGTTFPVINPATGTTVAEVSDCGPEEAKRAVDVSCAAYQQWKRTSVYERSRILRRFYELMLENKEFLAQLISEEMGKPIKESRGEIDYAAASVEWFAEEAKRLFGDLIPSAASDKRLWVQIAPVGPVVGVTPWNFPAAMVVRKLAPALACGCTFILKPAEQAPLTALLLAQLLAETGLPDGVFQVLPTNAPGPLMDTLLADPRIRKLTFTGSTEVGKMLYAKAAHTVKRVSLELGGHAPFLVFADANMERAAEEALRCKFRNSGQGCLCVNRIYVEEAGRERFVEAFLAKIARLTVGSPLDEATDVGPLVDQDGFSKVKHHVDDALSQGAKALVGGRPSSYNKDGYFFEPTVLADVTPIMRIMSEETFGPVVPILTFRSEDEAIELANNTPYGLAAYFFTSDIARIFTVSEQLDYGIIGINDGVPSTAQAPFGGVKASGVGREGGPYGIEEYFERKFVSTKL